MKIIPIHILIVIGAVRSSLALGDGRMIRLSYLLTLFQVTRATKKGVDKSGGAEGAGG
jgi:hypothetical protein